MTKKFISFLWYEWAFSLRITRFCNIWSSFIAFGKFYNDWSSRPQSSGTPAIFNVWGQKYRDLWRKSTEIVIYRRKLKKSWFIVETRKIAQFRTATNICPWSTLKTDLFKFFTDGCLISYTTSWYRSLGVRLVNFQRESPFSYRNPGFAVVCWLKRAFTAGGFV